MTPVAHFTLSLSAQNTKFDTLHFDISSKLMIRYSQNIYATILELS